MKDCLGNDIRIGDFIVYPVRQGSWMNMERGTVVNILDRRLKVKKDYGSAKLVTVERFDRVTVVKR